LRQNEAVNKLREQAEAPQVLYQKVRHPFGPAVVTGVYRSKQKQAEAGNRFHGHKKIAWSKNSNLKPPLPCSVVARPRLGVSASALRMQFNHGWTRMDTDKNRGQGGFGRG